MRRHTRHQEATGMLHPNVIFDSIYCLNLDRRPDRWRAAQARFSRWGISAERFSAVDGDSPIVAAEYHERLRDYIPRKKNSCKPSIESAGAFGCLLSHTSILKRALARGSKRILIFEDDVCFHRQFMQEFQKVSRLPANWKMLYLGASQHNWQGIGHSNGGFYHAKKTLGAFAVALDSTVFRTLMYLYSKKQHPADQYLAQVQHAFPEQCFVAFPNFAIADVSVSDIRPSRSPRRHAALMRWDLGLYEETAECLATTDNRR